MRTERNIRHYRHSVDSLRNVLAVCACLYAFGVPLPGEYGQIIFGFAYPALFIVSGFLVLREDEERAGRILRTVKRTAICFGILFIACLLLNLLTDPEGTVSVLCTEKFWVSFLLLNAWELPVGGTIWYVQALLYAYLILFVLEKAELLRFDWIFAILFLAAAVLTEELSGVIGFRFLGYTYLSGNFLTRALPYILIGCLMHRKLKQLKRIPMSVLIAVIVIGTALSIVEDLLLQKYGLRIYYGHYLLMGLVAAAICIPFFLSRDIEPKPVKRLASAAYIPRIFYFAVIPAAAILMQLFGKLSESDYNFYLAYRGIIIAVLSLLTAMLLQTLWTLLFDKMASVKKK